MRPHDDGMSWGRVAEPQRLALVFFEAPAMVRSGR
jgi:hypothetical protein